VTTGSERGEPNAVVRLFWNRDERRPRTLWRLLGLAFLFVAGTLLLSLLLGALLFLVAPAPPGAVGPFIAVISLASLIAILVSAWLAARFLDRRPFADYGLRLDRAWWLDLLFGLALGALLMTGIFLLEWGLGWIAITGSFRTADPARTFGGAILTPLVTFLCVGIYEELLTRGYLLRNLAEGLNAPRVGARAALLIAWLLSSAVFGLLHATNPNATLVSTINLVLAGLFLGLGYVLTGELGIPIGLHITWNFFQGNVFGFPVSGLPTQGATFIAIEQRGPELWTGGAFGPEAGLIGLGAMLLGSLLTVLWARLSRGEARLQTQLARYVSRHTAAEQMVTSRTLEGADG
jgi:uncharacterized protein